MQDIVIGARIGERFDELTADLPGPLKLDAAEAALLELENRRNALLEAQGGGW